MEALIFIAAINALMATRASFKLSLAANIFIWPMVVFYIISVCFLAYFSKYENSKNKEL